MNVLLIDDMADIRFLVRVRLEEDAGFTVVAEAATPEEGLSLATALEPDIVLADLFPDRNGVSFAVRLRSAVPQASIVIMSASASREKAVRRAMSDGADGFFDKGEGFAGIGGRIRAILGDRLDPEYSAGDAST